MRVQECNDRREVQARMRVAGQEIRSNASKRVMQDQVTVQECGNKCEVQECM